MPDTGVSMYYVFGQNATSHGSFQLCTWAVHGVRETVHTLQNTECLNLRTRRWVASSWWWLACSVSFSHTEQGGGKLCIVLSYSDLVLSTGNPLLLVSLKDSYQSLSTWVSFKCLRSKHTGQQSGIVPFHFLHESFPGPLLQILCGGNVLRNIWLTLQFLQIGVRSSRLQHSLVHPVYKKYIQKLRSYTLPLVSLAFGYHLIFTHPLR